jgi:hypothetical protein
MRAKRPLRVLLLLLAIGLLPATAVLATHNPQVSDVVAVAQAQGMTCTPDVSQVVCTGYGPTETYRTATVKPGSGPLDSLMTTAPAFQNRTGGYGMDANDQSWNTTMHNVGCDNSNAVAAFMAQVAALSALNTSVGPSTVGECTMSGTLSSGSIDFSPMYVVTSQTLPSAFATLTPRPTPTPTQAPTATPRPTVAPTATPWPTATARPTATATATATATPAATPATSASASASASASESAAATEAPPATPAATPEQSVEAIAFTPGPSVPPGGPDHGVGGWPGTVPSPGQISTKAADIGGSLFAALLLLMAMGFIGELFNDTFEGNYDRILGWWAKSWVGRVGRGLGGFFGGGGSS